MSGSASANQMTAQQALQAQNTNARALILNRAQNMVQSIASGTWSPGQNRTITVNPRLVGFGKRFYIELVGTLHNDSTTSGESLALTSFGAANFLSRVQFNDLSNQIRINTPGWHLHMVSSAKRGKVFGSSYFPVAQNSGNSTGFGANVGVCTAPVSIAESTSGTIKMVYEVPLTYSDIDLAGGIWLGVTSATAQLQFTINPDPVVNSAGDPIAAMYQSSDTTGGGSDFTTVTWNVYQNYLDQLPTDQKGTVILPYGDISTAYMLIDTVNNQVTPNQDSPTAYANFRDFLSTTLYYDDGGNQVNNDVNYFAISAANFVNYYKADEQLTAALARDILTADPPAGCWYFDHRKKPISTQQYGNTEFVLNPSSAPNGSYMWFGYEMKALISVVAQAGALSIG